MIRNLEKIVDLFHHRWAAPVLAELDRAGGGAKFVTLISRLGLGRESLRRTLKALIERGWVIRNPGYGHPMRPEYLLTTRGRRIAPLCRRLLGILHRLDVVDTGLRKWPLVVAAALAGGCGRFSDLKIALPSITARALAGALKGLQEAALIERAVHDDYPPRVEYRLTRRGRRIIPILQSLRHAVPSKAALKPAP